MASQESSAFPGAALVTGAARGIGASIALGFAAAGCKNIAITDILEEELTQTCQKVLSAASTDDINVLALPGDIRKEEFIDSFVERAYSTFGRLDYVVNCAGVIEREFCRSIDTTTEQFDFINSINYRGAWLCSRAALKRMVGQKPIPSPESWRPAQRGSIVNIASQLGIVSRPGAPAYCASKAALLGLTRVDAIDFAKDGIRVNCVCPGVIDTDMISITPERRETLRADVQAAPMGRLGDPREIADAVLFLSSSKASFVQGHALVVDGGFITK
ncbi:hypothetical protein ASPVEDRAFT_86892 [Aspergillus versicolor CBS 583.65]|uniref:Uncharacterized protein n=1 Tax=Aspergillus versicolor CBS 583.65 TaxID=1036611 RepID=A0A1L9PVH6_ASPVE|nr:uncharacterized protein ASPVEDRAFT_86892 [Aspergillus versicolor CBS 583.65]OJJ05549.1 hypothetical protein ASPVEDRAFT_86892 [Aspergillus versicolor CBS 583.65]